MIDNCPQCGANLQGEPIPPEHRHWYGGATHGRREIGVEVQGVYDGVLYWYCPDCGYAWPRFTEGRLAAVSARYAAKGPGLRSKPCALAEEWLHNVLAVTWAVAEPAALMFADGLPLPFADPHSVRMVARMVATSGTASTGDTLLAQPPAVRGWRRRWWSCAWPMPMRAEGDG